MLKDILWKFLGNDFSAEEKRLIIIVWLTAVLIMLTYFWLRVMWKFL